MTVEAVWIVVSLSGLVLSLYALREAILSRRVVTKLNGKAREINAAAVVRREAFRVILQIILIAIAVPVALREGDVAFSSGVALLMLIPFLLLATSAFDLRDQRRILHLTEESIEADRVAAMRRLEERGEKLVEAVEENTALTRETHDKVQHIAETVDG